MPIAQHELGQLEIPGPKDNPRILTYLHSTDLDEDACEHDETAWCSAFNNFVKVVSLIHKAPITMYLAMKKRLPADRIKKMFDAAGAPIPVNLDNRWEPRIDIPTFSAGAGSWLKWGARLKTPIYGCTTVFSRGGGLHHVAFYAGESHGLKLYLGGNQNNRVCIESKSDASVLGHFWPIYG